MKRQALVSSLTQALLVTTGLLAALVLTLFAVRLDIGASLSAMAGSSLGSPFALSRSLVRATPLILCGVGLCLAWKAGMFNIGSEGQYIAGGIAAASAYKLLGFFPTFALQLLILVLAAAGGAALSLMAAWLQAKRGVQVVISTILLNFIMIGLLGYAVNGPLKESSGQRPLTDRIPKDLMLWRPLEGLEVNLGVLIALMAAIGFGIWLYRTRSGFHLRLVGENPRAARASLVPVERVQMKAMALSGALSGLAGAVTYLGVSRQVGEGFAEGFGFLAIPVALLGGLNPIGAAAAGIGFGFLMAGGEGLSRTSPIGSSLVTFLQALAVLGWIGWQAWRSRQQPTPPPEEEAVLA